MRYLSICSGIEAASAAWHSLGWTPVGFAEIEPFPAAVLAHHYPDVPNFGDMTKFEDWDIGATDLDLLVGGTPCQAFSVAGLRKGLEDHRGNLTLTFIDLADHFDPEWIVWENVPGVLSSKDNAFGCFLAGLCGASEPFVPNGRWGQCGVVSGPKRTAAWRILDAQYTGVAQRRRRVFVVAVRGSRNWASAAALFPVGESVFWDSAPSRKTRQGITCSPEGIAGNVSSKRSKGTGGPAGDEHYNLIAPPITSNPYGDHESREGLLTVTHALRGEGFDASEDGTGRGTPLVPVAVDFRNGALTGDVAQTLQAHHKSNSLNAEPAVLMPAIAYRVHGEHSKAMTGNGIANVADPVDVARSLSTDGGYATNQGGNVVMAIQAGAVRENPDSGPGGVVVRTDNVAYTIEARAEVQAVAFDTTQITSPANYSQPKPGDPCHPLAAGAHPPAVAFTQNTCDEVRYINGDGQIVGALAAESGMKQTNYVAYGIDSHATTNSAKDAVSHTSGGPRGLGITEEIAPTLRSEINQAVAQPHAVTVPDTLYNKGFNHINEANNASTSQTHTRTLLLRVRQEIGEKAFAEWGLGILDSLQSPEILRSVLHGKELRQAAFSRRWVVCCALGSPFSCAEGAMFSLREASGEGCPPQRREPLEQLCGELGAYLSKLSQPGAQAERFLFDLWQASEGLGVLRQTLSAVQEVRRSAHDQRQPPFAVRRLVVEECEFLQGFPRSYTNIPWRGKPESPDGPRYRALGNSMAVPCMAWIGRRIAAVSALYEAAA